jgi:general secretion pathway protein C
MGVLSAMAEPRRARRIRQIILLLVVVWMLLSLTRLLWAMVPNAGGTVAAPNVINPLSAGSSKVAAAPVDINRMVAWHLFGEAGATTQVVIEAAVETDSRDGYRGGRAANESATEVTRYRSVYGGWFGVCHY